MIFTGREFWKKKAQERSIGRSCAGYLCEEIMVARPSKLPGLRLYLDW
jgi:hypothetical protein